MKTFPCKESWLPYRVSYGDTDAMGIVYYANYLHLFERSRNEIIRNLGFSYLELEKRGFSLPVRDAQCRYRSPLRYDDLAMVRGGLSEWGRASATFIYEIWNQDKTVLHATGSTQHALVDGSNKPVKVPDWLRAVFA
jgi:acyl-CoA thioester hydrolase